MTACSTSETQPCKLLLLAICRVTQQLRVKLMEEKKTNKEEERKEKNGRGRRRRRRRRRRREAGMKKGRKREGRREGREKLLGMALEVSSIFSPPLISLRARLMIGSTIASIQGVVISCFSYVMLVVLVCTRNTIEYSSS